MTDAEIAEIWRAISEAKDGLRLEGCERPKLPEIVWWLARDAAQTEARIPDRERSWLRSHERSIWPELARASEENRAIEWEVAMEEIAGVRPREIDGWRPKFTITDPRAVSRWLVVYSWFKYVKGRNPQRDREIFLLRALGAKPQDVSRKLRGRIGARAVEMVREKVTRHISLGLANVLDFA